MGTSLPGRAGPSTATEAATTPMYTTPTTIRVSHVARLRSRSGLRNSPARCVTASQPAKQKKSRLATPPTAQ